MSGPSGEWIHFQGRQLFDNYFCFLLRRVYSKRKEFAPKGSKFFPFRVYPFLDGICYCRKAKRKSQKLSAMIKMAENPPGVSIHIKRYNPETLQVD